MLKIILIGNLLFSLLSSVHANNITLNTALKAPLSTPNLTGFLDAIASEAFNRLGIKLDTVHLPAERALINANLGLIDGDLSRIEGLNKLYPNLIRVPEKILDMEFVAFGQKDLNLTHKWQSLTSHSVTFLNGWKIYEKNVPSTAYVTKVNSPNQLFSLLTKNRAELVLYERWGGLYYIMNNNINAHAIYPPLAVKEMYIYLHVKHTRLITPLAKTLKQIKLDGTYQAVFNRILAPLQK